MTTNITLPEVGQMAPDFRLRGPEGSWFTLSEHRGHGAVVLVFYPQAFSPVCSHQLPDFQEALTKLGPTGVTVYGVSVDSHWTNTAFARSLGLQFPLLSDWKHEASRDYGVLLPDAGYSDRATFVIGRDGRIVWRELSEQRGDLEKVPSVERALEAAVGA
jgi:peroxiredoxin (alkyl hydroperoxide reductase subunit C)